MRLVFHVSEAVASSSSTIGASFSRARAIEIRWRSPPESLLPFSHHRVVAVGQTLHELVAARRPRRSENLLVRSILLPRRMFSRTVSSKSTTSWNTSENAESSVSGSTVETSTPPTKIAPELTSQKREASLTAVLLPEPDAPTSAVTCPSRALNDTLPKTSSPSAYAKPTSSKTTS